jgi:acetolactate synthase-1/2/3 large subunit
MRIYQAMADAFHQEGVEVSFTLMGDGNMHFATALAEQTDRRTILVRHEHAAAAAATAYARATGKVGVASVTCGPGLTQLSTALATAVYARVPIVIFAGESPIDKSFYGQRIEQAPIVTATGSHYIHAHSLPRMQEYVRDAFFIARNEMRPVVIGVPYDKQLDVFEGKEPYRPSTSFIPALAPIIPNPAEIDEAVAAIRSAKNIIILAGRGAAHNGAAEACLKLARHEDALLATTLLARGIFDEDAFSVGIAGGYSSAAARDAFKAADLVVAVGASLNTHTLDGGNLFGHAKVLQIDTNPVGLRDALAISDIYVRADAKLAMDAILEQVSQSSPRLSVQRKAEFAERLRTEAPDPHVFDRTDPYMDPRDAVAAIDATLPKDWFLINGTGHSAAFSAHMRGRRPENFLTIREFGAIGNGISYAIGVAAAFPEQSIVLVDGDGSILMHIQELETIKRHGLRILICALNDGAYGPEIHKLRQDGVDDWGSVFGRGDLGAIARGFGLDGRVITSADDLDKALDAFNASSGAAIWDFHVSDHVISPMMRRAIAARRKLD